MSEDPLMSQLPISKTATEGIYQLASMLGFSQETFVQLLRSILIEELLDRLRPSKEDIRYLRMQPNHLELLQERIKEKTGVVWTIDLVHQYWKRIRLLDTDFSRDPVPFHRKLQVLATKEHKCEICGRTPPHVKLQVDHIYAASKGGSNDLWNLRILCDECNRIKSNHLDWRLYVT